MNELLLYAPVFGLIIAVISAIVAILTYRIVSTKHISKAQEFKEEIEAYKKRALFKIEGSGSFERLELSAEGRRRTKIILAIDGESCLKESLKTLSEKGSNFLKNHNMATIEINTYRFSVEIPLEKRFYKSLELFVDNQEENTSFSVNGTVHFMLDKKRF